jgi:hypothetical protein
MLAKFGRQRARQDLTVSTAAAAAADNDFSASGGSLSAQECTPFFLAAWQSS